MMDLNDLSCAEEWFLLKYYPSLFLKSRLGYEVLITDDILQSYQEWYHTDLSAEDYKPGGKYYYET